jgi:putative ABC transport system permease protein
MQCWVTGVLGDMIAFNARFATGHVKVMSKAYNENVDQQPNDLALIGTDQVLQNLSADYPGMLWIERINFGGLVDPEEILLSDEFATKLEVEPGDQVTLISTTMYGAMSITNFTVCGTVKFGATALDRGGMVADINSIRMALDMQDATGEILGYLPDDLYDDLQAAAISTAFNERYSTLDEFSPIMVSLREQGGMAMYLDLVDYFKTIIISVFMAAMAIVLWNSGLLGGLRRYGEMGLRIAIGEEKKHIYRSLITESIFIGLAGSVVGTAFGLFFASLLAKGIDITGMMGNSTMMMQGVMKARITVDAYYIGFIPGVLATAIGTALAGIGIFKRKTAQLFKELQA